MRNTPVKQPWRTNDLPRRSQGLLALLFTIGVFLTVWQIKRAGYKAHLLNHTHTEVSSEHITQHNHLDSTQLDGQFLSEHIFIQPRSLHHVPGYQVWVPFTTKHGNILVSLGFQTQVQIPSLTSIHGTIFFNTSPPFRMTNSIELRQTNASSPGVNIPAYIVGQLDLALFSQTTPRPLSPYILILDGATDQNLSIPSIDQVFKHVSYAIQFLLLTALACFYVYRQAKQTAKKNS